ncbi:hypothetical protein [Streptomyces flavidovirens]|uniref:hypothetical protein n=1 Tax=Streptomyces flavidovirens TaxID=67298 RepID=UPI00041A1809|nr:hypothetical protein [Streptomyces flavidovirens]
MIADLSRPDVVHTVGKAGRRLKRHQLNDVQRRQLMMETEDEVEPAMLWLGEHGMPMMASGWKTVLRTANQRCSRLGVSLAVHAHLLLHTFAGTSPNLRRLIALSERNVESVKELGARHRLLEGKAVEVELSQAPSWPGGGGSRRPPGRSAPRDANCTSPVGSICCCTA